MFDGALERPEAERAAFVAATCGSDGRLAQEVLALLDSAGQAGASLKSIVAAELEHVGAIQALPMGHLLDEHPTSSGHARFEIVALAGRGGFATVYRAFDLGSSRDVALKVFDRRYPDFLRFEREAQLLAGLQHEHVVRYFGHGITSEHAPFLVMEWLDGRDLARELGRRAFGVEESLRVGLRAALGLAAAHANGIVHRDIKPSNLFLLGGSTETVKVIDFGMARHADPRTKLTISGALLGTPTYMAPEQAAGTPVSSTSVDVFALGCVLFECLAGGPAFEGPNAFAVLAKIASGDVPRLSSRRPEIPVAIDALVAQMMAPDPLDRYADAAAVALAISDVLVDRRRMPKLVPGAAVVSSVASQRREILPVGRAAAAEPGIFVGRARELAIVHGAYTESSEERRARLVLVSGDAGIGKTSLIRAALHRIAATPSATILTVQADRPTSASPFALVRQFVRQRWRGSEAELCARLDARGVSSTDITLVWELARDLQHDTAPELTGRDPLAIADAIRCGWLAFIEAEVGRGPLVLVLEDLHVADAASVRLLGVALEQFSECPLLVIASARTDAARDQLSLLETHHPEKLEVPPLRPLLATELARALTGERSSEVLADIVAEAGGNPLRLVELAAFRGGHEASAAAAEAFEARLANLDHRSQHVLRAASVFGLRFEPRGVAELLGGHARGAARAEAGLAAAIAARCVRADVDGTFAFTHAIYQEAAYSRISAADREQAHLAAARWLARTPSVDPSLVAWHYERARVLDEAFEWYRKATRSAYLGGTLSRAAELADTALACEPPHAPRSELLLLKAGIAFARGATQDARAMAEHALAEGRSGTLPWFSAAASLITSAGQLGDNDAVMTLAGLVEAQPADASSIALRAVCLCRAATQLLIAGKVDRARSLHRVAIEVEPTDPVALAWIAHVSSAFAMLEDDFERATELISRASQLHGAAGDVRASCLMRNFKASFLVFAASFAAADAELDVVDLLARRVGADYVARWARYTRSKIVALAGDPQHARARLAEVRNELTSSPRIVAGTHIYGALAALRAADGAWAIDEARAAWAAHTVPAIQAVALAALARGLVLLDRHEEAVDAARTAEEMRAAIGRLEENESLVHLALPEALAARGHDHEARPLVTRALLRLRALAAKLSHEADREAYLHTVEVHAQTFRLAHRLGVAG